MLRAQQSRNENVPQVILDSDTESCGYHDASEQSFSFKLRAGPVSLTPVKLSADGSWDIDPVNSATIEVQVSTEAKSDPAGSDTCDRECNWGGLSFLIPENVKAMARALETHSIKAVTRALDALSRYSAKDLASTSTHCDCYERAVSIRNCIFVEYSWHLATSRIDVTSIMVWKCCQCTLILVGDGARVNRAPIQFWL